MKPRVCIGPVLVAVIGLVTGVAMAATPPGDIAQRLAALEAKVTALETELAAIKSSQVMALNSYLTVDPAQHRVRFTGVNLQLVNGTGKTDTINGRGNLILGYDLARDDTTYFCSDGHFTGKEPCERNGQTWAVSHKTGSHYLVIGDKNNYAQYGGLVVGTYNTSVGPSASVSGGTFNTSAGPAATVSGGNGNTAGGAAASVSGGTRNTASGPDASVSGGGYNTASEPTASVSGGQGNLASGTAATVSGGNRNTASGPAASLAGGYLNTASGEGTTVSGGSNNTASGTAATVSGGYQRRAIGPHDWAAGGLTQDQ